MVPNVATEEDVGLPIWEERLIAALIFSATIFGLLPSGFRWTDFDNNSSYVAGSIGFQLQWGSVFVVSTLIVARHRALSLSNLLAANPFILVMLIYCAASTIWSPAPIITIKKAIQFAGLILFGLAIQTNRRHWTHSIHVILMALTTIEFLSAIVAIVNPSFGVDVEFGYAWRGIVPHKNSLGWIGAVAMLLWVALGEVGTVRRSVFWFGFGLSLLCVVMSKSSTGMTIAAVGLFSYWLLRKQHITSPLWLLRLIVTAAMTLILLGHLFFIFEGRLPEQSELVTPVASLFGKNADLTGRVDIWEPLGLEIKKHWVLGIGNGAFWLGPGSASQGVLDSLSWVPFQGHNGYLDVLNELGLTGMLLFLGLLVFHFRHLTQLNRFDKRAAALFASILIIILFSNLTESSLFRGVDFPFMLMILSCVSVTSTLSQRVLAH